jgi:two-component SAPR family response regulator
MYFQTGRPSLPTQLFPASGLSILICEDEPMILTDVADILRQNGHVVTEVMTAADAMIHLSASTFDILIADVSLPDRSGVELAKMARRITPHIGVIFATAHVSVPEASEISSAIVLAKPYGEEDLLRAVSTLGSTPERIGNQGAQRPSN